VKIGFIPMIPVLLWALSAAPMTLASTNASAEADSDVEGSPEQTVVRLERALIENMKSADQLGYRGRLEALLPVMERVLAVEAIARFLFKEAWGTLEEQQRAAFRELFVKLSASNYAHSFDDYNSQKFEPVSAKVQSPKRALVRRSMLTGKGERVQFDYLLTPSDGRWKIVVITTDGVSQLSIKRSQYSRLIEQSGFGAVLEQMRDVIDKRAGDE